MYSFEQALGMVKNGTPMKRMGWPGKDEYIEYTDSAVYNGSTTIDYDKDVGNKAIAFHGMSGSVQLRWHASQADMLMDDWVESTYNGSANSGN